MSNAISYVQNTIRAKAYSKNQIELEAGGTITPGHLIIRDSNNKAVVHGSAGGQVAKMFALEDSLQGKGINDNYSSEDIVSAWLPLPGDVVYARVATNQDIAVGDFLVSAGNGTLKKIGSETGHAIIGVALTAVDTQGSFPDKAVVYVQIM